MASSNDVAHQALVAIIEHALDACIVEQNKSSLGRISGKKNVLFVASNELPLLDATDKVNRTKKLINQRAIKELDGIRYCMEVYGRCTGRNIGRWDDHIWKDVVNTFTAALPQSLVSILISATVAQSSGDLFSDGNQELHSDINTFLSSISGWGDVAMVTPLLTSAMGHASTTPDGKRAIATIVHSAMKQIKSVKRADEILTKNSQMFDSLQVLLNESSVLEIIGAQLMEDVQKASTVPNPGNFMETDSILCCLLSISTLIDKINPALLKDEYYSCYTSLRSFPNSLRTDVDQINSSVQDGVHKCIGVLHSVLLQLLRKPTTKNNVLSWMASVVGHNELRAGPKYQMKKDRRSISTDGFLVNFCSLMLAFCKPFFSCVPTGPKLPLISHDYPSSPLCRLDLHNEPCLADGLIRSPDRASLGHARFMCLGGNYKFVTECFFLTWRALHIGLLTAAETFLNTLSDLNKEIDRKGGEDKVLTELRGLYYFSGSCSLLDPQFVQMCGEFYITAAVWMTMLMESCNKVGSSQQSIQEEQVKILSKIPEVIIKDMMKWFHFVLRTRPNSLHGLQLTPMIDCCINLLNRPDLLPGPVAQTQIISVLLTCVSGNYNTNKLLSTDSWGGIHGELSAMVQGSPSFQGQLGPALLHTFSAVGVVEGLDVDKENFDKYTARYDMTQLLLYLWVRLDCRESIVGLVGSKRFELFLQAIFDTLLYLLNDCFTRIANIQKMEIDLDKSDTSSSVPHFEKKRKEAFLAGEQRSAKGLINMSGNMLKLLEVTTEVDSVSKHFCVPPLSTRSASAIMGFLDVLCGARQTELKIKDPQKINFDPRKLVSQLATIMAHIWQVEKSNKLESTGFVLSLVNHPDYSYSIVSKVASILDRHLLCTGDVVVAYKGLIEQLNKESGGPGDPLASAAALVGQAAVSSSPTVLLDWQREIDSVVIDNDSVSEMYTGALMDSIYDTADLQDSHLIGHKATDVSMDPRSPKLKAILRDIKQLQESLSLHPDSSIFIRQDEDRMDLVRVLITGPVDTPYSYGCFTFDIYYPSNYPVNPPLVLLATTGSGTIRFNPNLYADGKVCLSLLGTWHGGDSSEKWDPLQSNLLQVLVSIQGLILIPEPIYNEPGYEAMQGTPQGKTRSSQYNAYIQINTIRYAILEQLRNPSKGFEDIIRIHFMMLRDKVLQQCSKWLKEAVSVDHYQKLLKSVEELRREFDKI